MKSKMFEKKKGSKMSEAEHGAKKSVLESLRDEMSNAMGAKLHGLKKVSVASDSPKGLEKGLDLAKNLIKKKGDTMNDTTAEEIEDAVEGDEMSTHPTDNAEEGSDAEESEESPEEEASEDDAMSEEELDKKLEKLMALKKKKQGHSA
jgi:hypothetical protein